MNASGVGKLVGAVVLLLSLGAQAREGLLDRLQILRSESFRACASVLMDYDPYSRNFDPGRSDEYASSLKRMAAVIGDPGLAEVNAEYATFAGAIRNLESSPQGVAVNSVNNILGAQAKLVAAANAIYARQATDRQSAKKRLHELSIANAKMLLLYQIRPYGGMVNYPGVLLNDGVIAAIDAEIRTGLEELRKNSPDAELEIDAVQRSYDFVRPRIFDAQKQLVANGVNYYLGKNINRLDALAGRM